jgi:hypothetical protein
MAHWLGRHIHINKHWTAASHVIDMDALLISGWILLKSRMCALADAEISQTGGSTVRNREMRYIARMLGDIGVNGLHQGDQVKPC